MIIFTQVERGGHRARPRWTIHRLYDSETRCGLYPRRYHHPSQGRPQGEVKVCRRCFGTNQIDELTRRFA